MKLVDKSILLESFSEAYESFFAPTYWDFAAGGQHCAYYAAALFLKVEDSVAHNLSLEFSNKEIAEYWDKLEQIRNIYNQKFDFNTGSVIENRNTDTRDETLKLVEVAKKISERGFDAFEFEVFDDYVTCCRAVKVTDIKTTNYFIFLDIEDMAMYDSLVEWIQEEKKIRIIATRIKEAENFLKN